MKLVLSSLDPELLGQSTPDPLRFAFKAKTSAHAGSGGMPVAREAQAKTLDDIFHAKGTPDTPRCLYIHVPFCRVRCTFCNFFQNAASRSLVDQYFAALMTELEEKARLPWTQASPFHAVYIGGGTPTDLSPLQIRQLGSAIKRLFPLAADCEITLEGRINKLSDELFDNALEGGFNRFSFGIQSFDTKVRRSAKRLDEREAVLKRVQELSGRNVAPIVLDLLYGLPYQTEEVFENDLKDYLESGAHAVDLYQLMVGGSAPMIGLVEKGRMPPPANTAQKATMYQMGVEFMARHHQRQLSVNHWARDNRERSLYNSLAKTSAEVLPVGCGAGGNVNGVSMMHHRDLKTYMECIESGQSAAAMLIRQPAQAALFAEIKAGFDRGVISREKLNQAAGFDCFEYLKPVFEHWQNNQLVTATQDYLSLTLAGSFWAVTLAQSTIQILQQYYKQRQAA